MVSPRRIVRRRPRHARMLFTLTVSALLVIHLTAGVTQATRLQPQSRVKAGSATDQNVAADPARARQAELAATLRQLRAQGAETSDDNAIRAQWDAALEEYQTLSISLGDDLAQPWEGGSDDFALRTAPPAPPNCVSSSFPFSNATPQAIPNTNVPITSTITVAGAGPYLYDLDLTTFLPHTNSADLDVTISHGSTTVTITTDNGGANDNVFNGTVWDDSADPDGIPMPTFTLDANQVQVHPYTNNVVATPMTPEEGFAAFIGEDPNGVWTLTVNDDNTTAGTTGSLTSWSMNIVTLPAAPTTASAMGSNNTPVPISAVGTPVVTSTISISTPGTHILDVNAMVNITHTFFDDMQFSITSPAGTIVTLANGIVVQGSGSNDVYAGTLFDDDADPDGTLPYTTNANMTGDHPYTTAVVATPLAPIQALGAFIGENPNGTWTLTVADQFDEEGGTINNWSLAITTASCSVGPVIGADTIGAYVSSSNAWFLRNSNSAGNADIVFLYGGLATLVPIEGDWDNDGDDTPGVYNPATGVFFLRNSNSGGPADITFQFGAGGSLVPLAGDWNNDGTDTIGLYNPANGAVFLRNSNSNGNADVTFFFGPGGSFTPVTGDWNGDGTDSIGIYAPASGAFFLKNQNTNGNADFVFTFGGGGTPVAISGDWNGDGTDSIGLYVPASGAFFLRNSNSSGNADFVFTYGPANSTPVTGDWDGL